MIKSQKILMLILLTPILVISLTWPGFIKTAISGSLPAPTHPIMFGYYHADSQYGDFKSEVKDYTNTQIILEESWIRPPNITNTDIQNLNNAFAETIALGQKIIYLPAKNPNDWGQSVKLAQPFWQNIEFIYLADEPLWDKTTTENQIAKFKGLVSQAGLSQKQIAINYTPQQIQTGTGYQASNLNIVGFEAYLDPSTQNDPNIITVLNNQIDASKRKIGNKKMFIVVQGYDRNGSWTNLNSLQSIQTPPYLKSYNDSNVIGLLVFTYGRPGGTRSMSLLKTEHQNIGAAILGTGQNPPPVLISNEKTKNFGAGTFPDVTWHNGKFWMAVQLGSPGQTIQLYSLNPDLSGQKLEKTFNLSSNALAFPRLASYNNVLWLAYRDGDPNNEIKLWRQDTGATEIIGVGGGNDPAALGEGKIAWQDSGFNIFIRSLTGGIVSSAGQGVPTGISRVSNGQAITIDQDRNLVPWGLRAWVSGSLIVAEGPIDGVIGEINSTQFNLFNGEESFTPHGAVGPGGEYAVVTWGRPGVRISTFNGPVPGIQPPQPPNGGLPFPVQPQPTIPTEGLATFEQLVAMIFTWSLNILGIVVFVMIFYAGFRWFTAAGNTAQVNEAKSQITNAILGAILLLSAWIILYTINPDLVGSTIDLPGIGS